MTYILQLADVRHSIPYIPGRFPSVLSLLPNSENGLPSNLQVTARLNDVDPECQPFTSFWYANHYITWVAYSWNRAPIFNTNAQLEFREWAIVARYLENGLAIAETEVLRSLRVLLLNLFFHTLISLLYKKLDKSDGFIQIISLD